MSYEEQLNVTWMQLEHLVMHGVNVAALAGDGFKFDPEQAATLDEQIDYFAEATGGF